MENRNVSFAVRLKGLLTKKFISIIVIILILTGTVYASLVFLKDNKTAVVINALNIADKISNLLLIETDGQKELSVVNQLVQEFTKKDGITRNFLVLLQNNMELRPGGGFLGQYAILKIRDGEVVSVFVEDANLLDQKIEAKIPAPYPLTKMMSIKKWKFRDSNFSPDFPTNVSKAEYFLRLAGASSKFDGVIAVNSQVFNDILEITGPISVPGSPVVFDSTNATLKLEEVVEKQYLMDDSLDTQNRKWIMKKMAPIIVSKLSNVGDIPRLANFFHEELKNKNVMLNFKDERLQSLVEDVYWSGEVAQNWEGDYLMMVDANLGALKTDYYIKREIKYDIDLAGEKPIVTLNMLYKNTAPYGDWRTSDYHSYLRVYVPEGAKLLENKMVSPLGGNGTEFGKTYFGFILHAIIGSETDAMIKYELPNNFTENDYKLLVQKQSGVGEVPVKIRIKTKEGKELNMENSLKGDLRFEITK
ncbi:MAG: hypothetical protein ACD_15C00104G0020 [uncultured bacterium]|nr:MAG: hypothetical protein ACD_15C00104G0020 [uncultured bacterium]HCU70381.1 hypothetical protein [Candidatus Moranbacteria bacterium]